MHHYFSFPSASKYLLRNEVILRSCVLPITFFKCLDPRGFFIKTCFFLSYAWSKVFNFVLSWSGINLLLFTLPRAEHLFLIVSEFLINDIQREKLVLCWIQYKNSLKCKISCYWRFSCLHNQLSFFNSIIVQMPEKCDPSNRQ